MFGRVVETAALSAAFVVMATASASAYLDAGSGSMILQIIVGALAAGGATVKIYWHRIRALFRGSTNPESDTTSVEGASERE